MTIYIERLADFETETTPESIDWQRPSDSEIRPYADIEIKRISESGHWIRRE